MLGFSSRANWRNCCTARCWSIWYRLFIATLSFSWQKKPPSAHYDRGCESRYFLRINGHPHPALDFPQQFTGFRPFLHATQSETSVAAHGRNIVASYNSSAGMHLIQIDPVTLAFDRLQIGGFSTSTDGGKTFTSGFFPGVEGLPFTFGDPSIDVDSNGNFFFAQLGVDTNFNVTVQVNKSTDGGRT